MSSEIVKAPENIPAEPSISYLQGLLKQYPCYTSLNLNDVSQCDIFAKQRNNCDGQLISMDKQIFGIQNVVIQDIPDYIDKSTGEIKPLVRIVLITDDGKCYESFSKVVLKDIVTFIALYRIPPWIPPRIVQVQLRGKPPAQFVTIVPISEIDLPESQPTPKKR